MDLGIAGERAFILGGTQGLAFSAAKYLHEAGVKLALNGRDPAHGAEAVEALGDGPNGAPVFVQGDVSDPQHREALYQAAADALGGAPSILITNAGGPPPGGFFEHDQETWLQAMQTNMLSAIEIARLSLPLMIENGWGRILNITSFAVREPYPNLLLANAVRAGLHGAMSTLAREVAEKGVTVNNVLPGLMDTGALKRVYNAQSLREDISVDEAKARMAAAVPIGRLGEADDFGPACAFLCSRHAGYITAQNLTVDGGLVKALL